MIDRIESLIVVSNNRIAERGNSYTRLDECLIVVSNNRIAEQNG